MQNIRRNRIIAIIVVVVIIIGLFVWKLISYLHTFQTVTITYKTSDVSTVQIFHAATYRDDLAPHKTSKSLQNLTSGKTYKFKKGSYIINPVGTKVDTSDIALSVGDISVYKTLDVDYSYTYLQALTGAEEPTIIAALTTSNPLIASLYKVNSGELYHHGEWYGTTLSYKGKNTLSRDTLRVVLHQENGTWSVAVPPQISISALDYPNIPESVLSDVNAIDLGLPQIAT